MTVAAETPVLAARDPSLRAKLARAQRRRKLTAIGLVAPLFLFLAVVFVVPIGAVLYFSVNNYEVGRIMPRVTAALADWDGAELPGEAVYAALAADLQAAYKAKTLPKAALRLNYDISGFRSLVMRTGRKVKRFEAPYRDALIAADKRWNDLTYWRSMKATSSRFTAHYLLAAVDLDLQWDGSVKRAPPERTIYIDNLLRTLWMALVVTFWCIVIGYPLAYLIANSPARRANLLILLVLLPFWTSLLVRTGAWVILLQKEGVVNDTLLWLGLIDEPVQLIFNRIGVYIAMVHILLPFMVLPLYSVMKNIPRDHVKAAASLGARPAVAFIDIYLPQTVPGLTAGCMLVYVIALGFYITPALIGGGSDQMLAYLIAQFATQTANWGMAGALAILLLLCIALLYPLYNRFAGAGGIKLG